MFTGLISAKSPVKKIQRRWDLASLTLALDPSDRPFALGESIAVNGVCLTVASFTKNLLTFDLSGETLKRSTLGELSPPEEVNVERALRLGDPLGGHWVLGHVDGVGRLSQKEVRGDNLWLNFWAPPEVHEYIVFKGSIAVDGVSLTVAEVQSDGFSVAVIPLTARETTLGNKTVGSKVNLEADIIGKYVKKFLTGKEWGKKEVTAEFLREHGFL